MSIQDACRDNLIAIAKAFAKGHGISFEQVSKKYYGQSAFLRKFKAGKCSISIEKFDSMIAALKADWPPKADWPLLRAVVIHRPEKKSTPTISQAASVQGA